MKMKSKYIWLIIAVLLLFAGGIMWKMRSGSADIYDEDHKLRKTVTLEQLRSIEVSHGPLIGVRYSHGGGMQGDSNLIELSRDKDGRAMIRTSHAGEHSFSLIVHEYSVDEQIFDVLRERIDRDNLSAWADLPFDEEHIVLDGPSTSIGLIFDDTETGGYRQSSSWINYDNVMPEGGYDILNEFVSLLRSYIHKENLRDAYFMDDGKRITTGRETDNTDEEISALVSGYWLCSDGDEERQIYSYGLYETVEIMVLGNEERRDEVLTVKETNHEPYEDADTGWYVSLLDEDGASWVMYTEGMQLVIRRTDGSVIRRFDREN